MNAKANATVFSAAGLLRVRPDGPSHIVRRANKAYLKALREAELSHWTRETARDRVIPGPVARRLGDPGADRAETRVMIFLLAFTLVAVAGLLHAGLASGDFLGGVRAVVEGALR